ncbi:MAG: hypothetical protein ACRDRG_16595 [Pseudonocardiaceae bacterium]
MLAQTRSDVPALLLNGKFDAVTAPDWACPASRLLLFPCLGHDVVGASDCARSVMLGSSSSREAATTPAAWNRARS